MRPSIITQIRLYDGQVHTVYPRPVNQSMIQYVESINAVEPTPAELRRAFLEREIREGLKTRNMLEERERLLPFRQFVGR